MKKRKRFLKWQRSKLVLEIVCLIAIISCIFMYFYTWAEQGNLIAAVFYFLLALVFVAIFSRVFHFKPRTR